MTRLDTIITRQRKLRTRDLMFAAFLALAAVIGATSVASGWNEAPASIAKH